ncbi:hypothetical protein ABH926_006487 [Catenulispora sp. GP43]
MDEHRLDEVMAYLVLAVQSGAAAGDSMSWPAFAAVERPLREHAT